MTFPQPHGAYDDYSRGHAWSEPMGVLDDVRAFLTARHPATVALPATVAGWISDTTQSAVALLADATHFTGVDWARQHFPGNGTPSNESEALFRAVAALVPERRVPSAFPRIEERVPPLRDVTGQRGHRLYPAAADAFATLAAQATREGVTLSIRSSYRSPQTQAGLAARNPNRRAVASNSAHMYGLAFDLALSVAGLSLSEITTRPMTNMVAMYRSPVFKWMALRGHAFGWFPYAREPWHWEYNPDDAFRRRYRADVFGR